DYYCSSYASSRNLLF
nr:immunoglobulin light chain junction region [Macaca mulatta]MOX21143.1 immunoglobulin light chain junction region [Macaca mulatta]